MRSVLSVVDSAPCVTPLITRRCRCRSRVDRSLTRSPVPHLSNTCSITYGRGIDVRPPTPAKIQRAIRKVLESVETAHYGCDGVKHFGSQCWVCAELQFVSPSDMRRWLDSIDTDDEPL